MSTGKKIALIVLAFAIAAAAVVFIVPPEALPATLTGTQTTSADMIPATGDMVGLAVGGVILLAIIAVIVIVIIRHRR